MIHFKEAKIYSEGVQITYVDIDETICFYKDIRKYDLAIPHKNNINKINKLYDEGWEIVYWTARGAYSGVDYFEFTNSQLKKWGCKYNKLICGKDKGSFDLVIDNKAKRIEELEPHKIGFTCSSFDLLHPGHILMLKDCKNVGIKGIVLKAKKNIFLDKEKSIKFANKNKIFIKII